MDKNKTIAAEIWNIAVRRIGRRSDVAARQYFARLIPISLHDDRIELGISDDFLAGFLQDNYGDILSDALSGIQDKNYTYSFVSGYELKPVTEAASPAVPAAPAPVAENAAPRKAPRLRPSLYTFENFVTGYNNRHAYAMAKSVARMPGEIYNPLFIYGTNGVGKTHLLQAIAHQTAVENPRTVVRCVTCDEMLNDFYDLLNNGRSLTEFRSSFCDADVLLIDDIHRLAGKPRLQEEFFNIFNVLCGQNKQIVLTSDRQPCELSDIDKRLSSRFEQGMSCQVGMPEYEEKLVILRMWREASLTNPPLPDAILEFLAENISSTVRRLRGCFLRLTAYAEMSGSADLSIAEAENLLHAQLAQECADRCITAETIQRTVANHFGITLADMIGKNRSRNVADPRMIAMYLCRKLTKLSSNEIGDAFGRTHANILHAAKTVSDRCSADESVRRVVAQLERVLQKQ